MGRLVYNTGPLSRGRLWLVQGRETRELGLGVHARWLPDSRGLILAVPEVGADGRRLAGSRLALWQLNGRTRRWLTPAGGCPMQPALSPDGRLLVWSDWHSGAVWLARLALEELRP